MKELPKVYEPQSVERKIYAFWERGNWFHAEPDPEKKEVLLKKPVCWEMML